MRNQDENSTLRKGGPDGDDDPRRHKSLAEIHDQLVGLPVFRKAVERAEAILANIPGVKVTSTRVDPVKLEAEIGLTFSYTLLPPRTDRFEFHIAAKVMQVGNDGKEITLDEVLRATVKSRSDTILERPRVIAEYLTQSEFGFSMHKLMVGACSQCKEPWQEGYVQLVKLLEDESGKPLGYRIRISLGHINECSKAHKKEKSRIVRHGF